MSIHRSSKRILSKAAWRTYNTYRNGVNFNTKLSEVTALFNASRETILAFRRERLLNLLQHAYQTTSYYRDLLKTDYPDLLQIPPLEKQTIREHLTELCSESVPLDNRIKNATGGSTGTPLTFYQDRDYWNQRNLSVYYFDRWSGWDFGQPQLIIWGALTDLEERENWKQKLNNFWRNQNWLNGFQLTDTAMHNFFLKMEKLKPETIIAYPSSLYQFAKFLTDNELEAKCQLRGIISSAEMLHPQYRKLAETVFHTKIYNRYGGREVGLIAMECTEGRMHINCRDIYLEIDSEEPYKTPGDILITQLNNYAMPFIRYRIGDIGLLSDEMCPCGNQLPILGELLGRSTATFRTEEGKLIHGGYFTQQFYDLVGISQFQLIQETLQKCVIKIVKNKDWKEETNNLIQQKIKNTLGSDVSVSVEFVDEIVLPKSGKREFTISKVTEFS